MWERRSDKDDCEQDMSVPRSCTFRPSCDLFVSSFFILSCCMFFVVKPTESVIDGTVTVHSEPDILKNVGGNTFGIMGNFITTTERLFNVE
jgi:hypothetical protein